MSKAVVLKKFNKLSGLVGKEMAIVVMWNELSQEIKDGLDIMTLFEAYQKAMPGLKGPISQEIIKRKDISFEELEKMYANVAGDCWFLSRLKALMEAAHKSFKRQKGASQKTLSKMIKAALTTEDRLNILSKVGDGMAGEVFDKIIFDIQSEAILPPEFVMVCRYAIGEKGAYSKELRAFIDSLDWSFDKWRGYLPEARHLGAVQSFFLEKMYAAATTFAERWIVYDSYNDFSLKNPNKDEMICGLIGEVEEKVHLSKLFGESLSGDQQVAIIEQINRKKIKPFSWELSVLLDSCRKKDNDILADFFEGIMAEQALGFAGWQAFLDKSRNYKKEYILQMLSQNATLAREWLYVYDKSLQHDYLEMANKAINEIRKISALA